MTTDPTPLVHRWAEELPRDLARRLAYALRSGPDAVRALRTTTVLPASASALRQAIEIAQAGDGPYSSGMLTALMDARAEQTTITPVWTGPESNAPAERLTLAVIADLISEAQEEVLLVSYATIPGPEVRSALALAAGRGVEITTLLERSADNPHFANHGEPFPDLRARRLYWAASDRPPGAAMHAKVLVVDRCTALVGSANLTGHGLERNLECGLLIRGGPAPRALVDHLLQLAGIGFLS